MAYSMLELKVTFFSSADLLKLPPSPSLPPGKAEVRERKVPIKAHNESGTGLCKAARCKNCYARSEL